MDRELGRSTCKASVERIKEFFVLLIFLSRETIKTTRRSNAITRRVTIDTNPYTIGSKTLLGANEVKGGVLGGAIPSKMAR